MEEIWKPVACNKNYEVSNFGNIRNLKGHLLSQHDNGYGYKNVMLYETSKRKVYYVHRLVAEAVIENPENQSEVNHLDGNKGNNILSNLEWCTSSENERHSYDELGKINGNRKLSDEAVEDIINNCSKQVKGVSKSNVIDFMIKYRASRGTILNILNKKYYV